MAVALSILLPALAGLALLCSGRRLDRAAAASAIVVAAVVFALDLALWAERAELTVPFLSYAGSALPLQLSSAGEGAPFATLAAAIGLAILLYSRDFLERSEARGRYFGWMLVFLAGMTGLSFSQDLLSALIGFEAVGTASWALIGFWYKEADRARDATRAFLVTRAGDLGLYAAAMAAFASGDLRFDGLAGAGELLRDIIAAGLIVAALGKSAQLPFTGWLSGAMSGPTPVSAYLHSATLLAAGPLLLTKAAPLLGSVPEAGEWILWIGVATALFASVTALLQEDAKQMLAASSVAQFGFVFAAIGAGSVAAADAHLFEHGVFKAALFLVAGLFVREGLHRFGELGGLRHRLPFVAGFALIAAAALGGIPPFGGFFTKDKVLAAVGEAGSAAYALLLLAAFLTAAYAARFWLSIFAGSARTDRAGRIARPSWPILAAIGALAVASILLAAIALPPLEDWFTAAIDAERIPPWKWPEALLSTFVALAAAGWIWLLRSQGRLVPFAPHGLVALSAPARRWFSAIALLDACGRAIVGLGRALDRLDRLQPAQMVSRLAAFLSGRGSAFDGMVRPKASLAPQLARIAAAFENRALGHFNLVWPASGSRAGADISARFDRIGLDGAIRLMDRGFQSMAAVLGKAQSGLLHQYYVLAGAGTAALFSVALWVLRF